MSYGIVNNIINRHVPECFGGVALGDVMLLAIFIVSVIGVAVGFFIAITLYAAHSEDIYLVDAVALSCETKLQRAMFCCANCGSVVMYKDTVWHGDLPRCRDCAVSLGDIDNG